MKVISGFNALRSFEDFSGIYRGKKILLVTGKRSFSLSGAQEELEKILAGQALEVFSDFDVNPKVEDAFRGAQLARDFGAEVIISVGGGSVLDMAKLIKAFSTQQKMSEIADDIEHSRLHVSSDMPLIAVPTTAGSGSEATHFAVVYVAGRKYSVAAQCLRPNAVVIDGKLAMTGDKYAKACNAMDATAQAIESFWAVDSTEESRNYAREALRLVWPLLSNFDSCLTEEKPAQQLAEAAHFAGQAINISKTTAAHAWSYGITSDYNIPHGHAVWLTLPEIFAAHLRASDEVITDPRGPTYFKRIMQELCYLLGFDEKKSVIETFHEIMISLLAEPSMEMLGMTRKAQRRKLSENVNLERMANHPINLSYAKKKIFDL